MISRLDWPTLRFLRLRAQPFTGYNMLYLRNGAGFSCTDPIPPNIDNFQPDMPENEVVLNWKAFTQNLPDRFIYRAPLMLGERGWLLDGDFVNHDVATNQERIALMVAGGVFEHLDWWKRQELLKLEAVTVLWPMPSCQPIRMQNTGFVTCQNLLCSQDCIYRWCKINQFV